jgi:hypothetical protein
VQDGQTLHLNSNFKMVNFNGRKVYGSWGKLPDCWMFVGLLITIALALIGIWNVVWNDYIEKLLKIFIHDGRVCAIERIFCPYSISGLRLFPYSAIGTKPLFLVVYSPQLR